MLEKTPLFNPPETLGKESVLNFFFFFGYLPKCISPLRVKEQR